MHGLRMVVCTMRSGHQQTYSVLAQAPATASKPVLEAGSSAIRVWLYQQWFAKWRTPVIFTSLHKGCVCAWLSASGSWDKPLEAVCVTDVCWYWLRVWPSRPAISPDDWLIGLEGPVIVLRQFIYDCKGAWCTILLQFDMSLSKLVLCHAWL